MPQQTSHSLSKLACTTVAAIGLAASSITALAVPIETPAPVPYPTGSGVALIPDPSPAAIPGFGFVDTFFIEDFTVISYVADGADGVETLTANFVVSFEDGSGNPTGSANLPGDFQVRILGRPGNFDAITGDPILGTFDAILELATFNGTTSSGDAMTVRLDPTSTSTGQISITENPAGGFFFDTPTPFIVQGQYNVNGGTFNDAPNLTAENQPIGFNSNPPTVGVPEPATLTLTLAGLLGGLAVRRRRAAKAI